ncbi:hypothetical protein I7I51_02814 [Histoplasma capsulatum]|uniref:C2H2-type domain-containing protein n=1 Tax=Ajellomyces capsulatus TaxID=5037 RepID=A0A8A1MLB5_AJECA|nr:hypothetical protein I7I51_02814 [Histoplasma capsulatum]
MFPTGEEEAVGNYISLQRSKEQELQNLIQNAGEYPPHNPGFYGVLPSLSKIVKLCLENGKAIANLEELENEALKQFKELEKPDFDKSLGMLLDWSFTETGVNLILWNGQYGARAATTTEAMHWLFPEIPHIQYACTKCFVEFGNKKEWIRHENTEHFQMQAWRCPKILDLNFCPDDPAKALSTNSSENECARCFDRKDKLQKHLCSEHGYREADVKAVVSASEIGRNGQGQTWCGFCRKLIPLQQEGQIPGQNVLIISKNTFK